MGIAIPTRKETEEHVQTTEQSNLCEKLLEYVKPMNQTRDMSAAEKWGARFRDRRLRKSQEISALD